MNSIGYIQLCCVVVAVLISSSSAWFMGDYHKRSSPSADDCPPVCMIYCPYGNVLDEQGCRTCECINDPCRDVQCEDGKHCVVHPPADCDQQPCHFETSCCPPICKMHCENGFVHDDGCPICKCNP